VKKKFVKYAAQNKKHVSYFGERGKSLPAKKTIAPLQE